MSASLVGSEMCIRDRRLRPLGRGQPPQQRGRQPLGARKPRPRGPHPPRCLLYTSDAADDM
eukprot:7645494-Alexandrium_andersonii.AAC.1